MIDYNIWYSKVQLPNKEKLDILKEYQDLKRLYEACQNDKFKDKALQRKLIEEFNPDIQESIKSKMYQNHIHIINYFEDDYPERLRLYDEAPSIIYYKGDILKLDKGVNISLVGSRRCTPYGANIAKNLAIELSKNNINIISGMAAGIDSVAHGACIENEKYTCAILGSGLDVIYPRQNTALFEKICKCGCVISEYMPGTQPLAFHFPVRNRIISQLSDLVIVIEAGIKSGSLITARYALEVGIDVMAVPGSILMEAYKGTNSLIKDGVTPLTCIEDVYDLLSLNIKVNRHKAKKNFSLVEEMVYGNLSDSPLHLDDLIKRTKVDIKQLYEVLFELQLKEEIICLAGNYYVRNNKAI